MASQDLSPSNNQNRTVAVGNDEMSTIFSGQTVPESLSYLRNQQKRVNLGQHSKHSQYNDLKGRNYSSKNKSRLKSANIYSQKIKMYNPNMLIFTPNQMIDQNSAQLVQRIQ